MKIGRDDPCPCGSGKKYKRCCMDADRDQRHEEELSRQQEEAISEETATPRRQPSPPPPSGSLGGAAEDEAADSVDQGSGDPHRRSVDARWNRFEAADYQGRVQCFLETLDEPELMDGDLAYEMLSSIQQEAKDPVERERMKLLLGALREKLPEAWDENAAYFLSWLIEGALSAGDHRQVISLGKQMAATAGSDADMFQIVVKQLAYHGELTTLVEMMRIAWPLVRESGDILPWGVEECLEQALWFETLDYVANTSSPQPDDPQIHERLERYGDDYRKEWLHEVLDLLSGRTQADVPGDAAEGPKPKKGTAQRRAEKRKQWQRQLYLFSLEFLRYASAVEGLPHVKAQLARQRIFEYLVQRAEGELSAEGDPFEVTPRRRKKPRPQSQFDPAALCPDRRTLDRYLAGLFGIFGESRYEVGAVMELVPVWLRFLRRGGLLQPEQHAAAFDDLAKLNRLLQSHWKDVFAEPCLHRGAAEAWSTRPEEPSRTP